MVRCAETPTCPYCDEELRPYGKRLRIWKKTGEVRWVAIRRLYCSRCISIHHEIPDFLVPYKHYENMVIEQAVTENSDRVEADVEESTIRRWRTWYESILYCYDRCIASINEQLKFVPRESMSDLPLSAHQKNGHSNSKKRPKLAKIVHTVVNSGFWKTTQFAFLSKNKPVKLSLSP